MGTPTVTSRVEVKAAPSAARISDALDFLKRENGVSLTIEQIGQVAAADWTGKR